MNCKRCGSPLPSKGYVCSKCGMLMSSEQIKVQKESIKNNSHFQTELVSEKYGGKKQIFQKREDNNNSYGFILFILGGLLLFILILVGVYFL